MPILNFNFPLWTNILLLRRRKKEETIHKRKIKSSIHPACDWSFGLVPSVNPLNGKRTPVPAPGEPGQSCRATKTSGLQHQRKWKSAHSDYPPSFSLSCIYTKKFVWCKPNWVMFSTSQGSPSGFCAITEMKFIIHITAAKILFQGLILPFCLSKPHTEVEIFILVMFV